MKENKFDEDITRGYLETYEPLEALYGDGWWTNYPDYPPRVTRCPICGSQAYLHMDKIDCEYCQKERVE